MRHSHAVSNNPAFADYERPLTEPGRVLAVTTSDLLAEWPVDEIICSSATRAVETANIVASNFDPPVSSQSTKELYLASPASYSAVVSSISQASSNCVAMVGHNPGIASLICSWANDSLSISPATVAVFQLAIDDWKQLSNNQEVAKELTAFISNGVRIR